MTNQIQSCRWLPRILDPTLAEVVVSVFPECLTSRTQLRGQLTGPQCTYSTTIEVAYPWRELARICEKDRDPCIQMRAVIPEPSLWEPQTPFLYEGTVELWEDGHFCNQVKLHLGLRDLKLGGQGFLLNGRPFAIHGVAREQFPLKELPELRQAGFNTLLSVWGPLSVWGQPWCDLLDAADWLGFLVIVWLREVPSVTIGRLLNRHPSALGIVVGTEAERGHSLRFAIRRLIQDVYRTFTGLDVNEKPAEPFPAEEFRVDFLFCDQSLLADLSSNRLPKLVRLCQTLISETESQELLATPGVCGWVLDPFL